MTRIGHLVTNKHLQSKGFSLVELLVVIAVLGILTAITLPVISGIFDTTTENTNRRNAQNIVSVFNSAKSAGAILPSGSDMNAVFDSLIEGVSGRGPMSNVRFQLSQLSENQRTNVQRFITASADGLLNFNPNPP